MAALSRFRTTLGTAPPARKDGTHMATKQKPTGESKKPGRSIKEKRQAKQEKQAAQKQA